MIYLIDDTPRGQIEQSLSPEAYGDVMVRMEAVDREHISELSDADCIMMHYSFHDKALLRQVRDDISGYGEDIPLVFFSDGDLADAVFYDDTYRWIQKYKKGVMYTRLSQFLEYYRACGNVDLRILAYGDDFLKVEVNRLAERLLSAVMFNADDEIMDMDLVDSSDLLSLVDLSQPSIAISGEDLLTRQITVAQFRLNISSVIESFNRYGKNIHHWK